ncbi:MAG: hypothetical protein ACYC4L_14155 [Chloroflexota bacterium]
MEGSSLRVATYSFLIVGALSLVPGVGMFGLAPLAAAVIGGYVAWRAARHSGSASRGTALAVTAGLGAMLGTAVFLAVAATVLGSLPAVQDLIRASEPHPEARLPYEWIAPVAAMGGVVVGLLLGFGNLVLAAFAGFISSYFGAQGAGNARGLAR